MRTNGLSVLAGLALLQLASCVESEAPRTRLELLPPDTGAVAITKFEAHMAQALKEGAVPTRRIALPSGETVLLRGADVLEAFREMVAAPASRKHFRGALLDEFSEEESFVNINGSTWISASSSSAYSLVSSTFTNTSGTGYELKVDLTGTVKCNGTVDHSSTLHPDPAYNTNGASVGSAWTLCSSGTFSLAVSTTHTFWWESGQTPWTRTSSDEQGQTSSAFGVSPGSISVDSGSTVTISVSGCSGHVYGSSQYGNVLLTVNTGTGGFDVKGTHAGPDAVKIECGPANSGFSVPTRTVGVVVNGKADDLPCLDDQGRETRDVNNCANTTEQSDGATMTVDRDPGTDSYAFGGYDPMPTKTFCWVRDHFHYVAAYGLWVFDYTEIINCWEEAGN